VSVLAAMLIADLLFFMFFTIYYPEMFQLVLDLMPWKDSTEKAIMIIIGLVIAVATSGAIVNILVKSFQKEPEKVTEE